MYDRGLKFARFGAALWISPSISILEINIKTYIINSVD